MRLRVVRSEVSRTSWGEVDKTRIRQILVQALEEGQDGAAAAVREVYAVIRGDSVEDAPSENWWGPHHEIREDGAIVLNENGLEAAAAALAGARADPNLTPEQKRRAARHLLRHYRELKKEPPESLLRAAGQAAEGEMVRLTATLAGEMSPADIPLGAWVDLEALKAGDDDPMEVVVRIPEGRSKRGWYYTSRVLERIAAEINATGLPGFLGHQEPDKIDHEFPTPVTHWIGAVVRDEGDKKALYARGVIDKAAADLKRWVRGKAIRQVSIFGIPTLQTVGGETRVIDFLPLSIDWTPLNRAGMPTAVVAVGEMDAIPDGGDVKVAWTELAAQLRDAITRREATVAGVLGEMGLSLEDVAREVAQDRWQRLEAADKAIGEMAQMVGLQEAAPDKVVEKVVERFKQAIEAEREARKAQRAATLDKVIGEMVAAETVRPLVRRLVEAQLAEDADEQAIRIAVGEMLQQDDVRKALEAAFGGWVPPVAGGDSRRDDRPSGLIVRRVAI